jgi:hypothetical protein
MRFNLALVLLCTRIIVGEGADANTEAPSPLLGVLGGSGWKRNIKESEEILLIDL